MYKRKWRNWKYRRKKARRKRIFKLLVAVVAVVISATVTINTMWCRVFDRVNLSSMYMRSENYPLSVYFVNAGSASCVLVRSDEANILVDCGLEKVQSNILDLFVILGISALDLVILTHPDKDHIGNLADIAENIPIKRFVTCENGDYKLSGLYKNLLEVLYSRNIEVEYAKSGDSMAYGELSLEVVSPTKIYDIVNDNSVVVKISYGELSVLLTGDISSKAEKDILQSGADISTDVLLVPHHGSGSSASREFLQAVNPHTAVISVEQSDYLPNDSTISRLIDCGCEIYRTDKSGNIAVASDGRNYTVITEY